MRNSIQFIFYTVPNECPLSAAQEPQSGGIHLQEINKRSPILSHGEGLPDITGSFFQSDNYLLVHTRFIKVILESVHTVPDTSWAQ